MTDTNGAGPEPERVIPPPPPAPVGAGLPGSTFPPVAPLAPPLSGPPAPPGPPTPPLPPYAAGYPSSPPPGPPGYGTYPAGSLPQGPPPASGSNRLGIVLAVIGGFVVLSVVGVAVVVGMLLAAREEPATAPPPSVITEDPAAPPADPAEPAEPDTSYIEAQLEAKINEYKRLRESGALWESIPDNEYNRTAVSAFLYLLTDMKVATIWGVTDEQAQEYEERMLMLEERLLAEEPLGDDITITLEDEVFTYDGDTGEGGYTPK